MLVFILSTVYNNNATPKRIIISLNNLDHAYCIPGRNGVGHVLVGGEANRQLQILVLCCMICLRSRRRRQW